MADAVKKILAHISNACVEDGHEYACTCSACQTLRERTAVRAVAEDCAEGLFGAAAAWASQGLDGIAEAFEAEARAIREKYGIE